MLRLKITREEGLYYWAITRHGEPVYAGLQGFRSEEEADADARVKWQELTGQCPKCRGAGEVTYGTTLVRCPACR